MKKVIIYSTRICPYCVRAKNFFDKKNLSIFRINKNFFRVCNNNFEIFNAIKFFLNIKNPNIKIYKVIIYAIFL